VERDSRLYSADGRRLIACGSLACKACDSFAAAAVLRLSFQLY
jgi:hypothetical protein